jgi:hypothetical protein
MALKSRAAFDLDCPKSEIKTVTIDDATKGVTGCGQRATYVRLCKTDRLGQDEDCQWLMNTDARRTHAKKRGSDDEE